ncbi:MAG: trypsin-like peptidase domain-containing protein [Clostridiales bacterium]|nr:trypsin-like peptidase domain-containing protein [Clostridiales bacterium]
MMKETVSGESDTMENQEEVFQAQQTDGNQNNYFQNQQADGNQEEFTQEQQTGGDGTSKSSSAKSGGLKMVALALCCALIGGVAGAGVSTLTGNSGSSSSTTILTGSRDTTVNTSTVDTSEELTASEVYAQNVNSTVGITTTVTTNYFGYETTSAASGSGFILTSDGYVLTNYHVIEDSSEITVSTYDGTTYDAELIGYDESNDIAVLKIEASDLTPVVLGDSDALSVGDSVVAIGNPLGELTFSLTSGSISALNRSVTMSTNVTMTLIQTDCAINSGNSGGALFNMYGEVIGITNAKYSSSDSSEASIDNIGFAIPINEVKDIVTSIIESGTYEKSYIGVSVIDASVSAQYGYESPVSSGAVVMSVTEGSPAEEAGLQAGDVITKADDTEISGGSELSSLISSKTSGEEVVLTVYRDSETMEITVTVGSQTQSALPDESDSTDSDTDSSGTDGSDNGITGGDNSGNSDFGNGNSGKGGSGRNGQSDDSLDNYDDSESSDSADGTV